MKLRPVAMQRCRSLDEPTQSLLQVHAANIDHCFGRRVDLQPRSRLIPILRAKDLEIASVENRTGCGGGCSLGDGSLPQVVAYGDDGIGLVQNRPRKVPG